MNQYRTYLLKIQRRINLFDNTKKYLLFNYEIALTQHNNLINLTTIERYIIHIKIIINIRKIMQYNSYQV